MTEKRASKGEVRIESDDGLGRAVGYAAVFNSWSENLGGFREMIMPGAFKRALERDDRDVVALLNHDPNLLLGRDSNDTLVIQEDQYGLRYSVKLPNTTAGRDAKAYLERRDIVGSSFKFYVAPGKDEWTYRKDGLHERRIMEFDALFDVGPVTSPAYRETNASAARCMPTDLERRAQNIERLARAKARKVV